MSSVSRPSRHIAAVGLAVLGGLTMACTGMAQPRTDRSAAADTTVTTLSNAGSGTNRITVVGNSAGHVELDCARDGVAQADVNSVTIDGAALQGKTIIVTGRNSKNVTVRGDCARKNRSAAGSASVNSVTIR